MIIRDGPNPVGTEVDDLEPSADHVRSYFASLADAFGLPRRFVLATAQTESGFDAHTVHARFFPGYDALNEFEQAAKAYGPIRVSDVHIGETVRDAAGKPFQIAEDIKTDWKASAAVGVARLAQLYQLAGLENPLGSLEEWAQQAYSGYSAGSPLRDRYLSTLADELPAHPRDRAFLHNFRKGASRGQQGEEQSPAPNAQQSLTPQQPQSQAPGSPVRASQPSVPAPLPAPLQRLKENPGNLFLQASSAQAQESASAPTVGRGVSLVPSTLSEAPPGRSLGNVAFRLALQQPTGDQSSGLPAPIQRLKESPGDLFLEPFLRGRYFSQVNLNVITENEGGNRLTGYFPGDPRKHPNAGVTIGVGVDLGRKDPDELRRMGVPENLIDRFISYFGLTGAAADKAAKSLRITPQEASRLNHAVMVSNFNAVGSAYNSASSLANFTHLPWQAQTVIADLWYNMGGGRPGGTRGLQNTRFWEQVTSGKWQEAYNNLTKFAPNQADDSPLNVRARKDAQLLKQALDAATLPRP